MTVAFNNIFESGKALLRAGAEGFHHLLWPAVCDNCGAKVAESEGLCGECWGELLRCSGGDYCRRCGKDVSRYAMIDSGCGHCHGMEICYDGIARAGVYDVSKLSFAYNNSCLVPQESTPALITM